MNARNKATLLANCARPLPHLASAGPSAFGGLIGSAHAMLGEHLNVCNMRPYIDPHDGESKVVVQNKATGEVGTIVANAQATLQYDEWKDIDRAVIEIATLRWRHYFALGPFFGHDASRN